MTFFDKITLPQINKSTQRNEYFTRSILPPLATMLGSLLQLDRVGNPTSYIYKSCFTQDFLLLLTLAYVLPSQSSVYLCRRKNKEG